MFVSAHGFMAAPRHEEIPGNSSPTYEYTVAVSTEFPREIQGEDNKDNSIPWRLKRSTYPSLCRFCSRKKLEPKLKEAAEVQINM